MVQVTSRRKLSTAPWECVKKIAHSLLCYNCNINDIFNDSFWDPFRQSLRSISSSSRAHPIQSELEMKQHTAVIISSQLNLLKRLILCYYLKETITFPVVAGKQEEEKPLFEVKVALDTDSMIIDHPTLRTMTSSSTPCLDILISVSLPCESINQNKTWILNQSLCSYIHA